MRTQRMGRATGRKTFYELCADGPHRPLHCLIELEHPVTADPGVCWLQASIEARNALERMPTPDELRPVTSQMARRLAKTLGLSRRVPR